VPSQNNTHGNHQRSIERGRALVEQYAAQSDEYGPDIEEHTSVAGDLIGDVLTYVGDLVVTDLPPAYQSTLSSRLGCVAARGVWNALARRAQILDHDGADPDPDDLQPAAEAITDYLRHG
jgi:hypothetical protein